MPSIQVGSGEEPRQSLPPVLWIGGAQWAGKTIVAHLLGLRYPLISYSYDYHDARAHSRRVKADPARYPSSHAWISALARDPDDVWVGPEPREMADATLSIFSERFAMVLDDLAARPSGVTILAEGWGLRPDFVAPLIESPRQAIFLVPTEAFRQQQIATLPRAGRFPVRGVTDPERAQRNRVERDRILARDVVEQAERLGLRVVHVDGEGGAERTLSIVEEHFKPFLPTWIY